MDNFSKTSPYRVEKKLEQKPSILFDESMFQLLYARNFINAQTRVEGSLSSARAMAQLRQFYFRSTDPDDKNGFKKDWEDKRKNYEDFI